MKAQKPKAATKRLPKSRIAFNRAIQAVSMTTDSTSFSSASFSLAREGNLNLILLVAIPPLPVRGFRRD